MVEVRLAVAEDIPGLILLGGMYLDEMPDDRPEIDAAAAQRYLTLCIESPYMHMTVLDDDGIKGGLHGFAGSLYLSAPEAHIDMIYVQPSSRSWIVFRRLWASFEEWAGQLGATHISASESSRSLAPLFRRLGMQERGTYYRKAL